MNKVSFKNWMLRQPNIEHVGKVAVFYIPVDKIEKGLREKLHDFLVSNYNAYTHESSEIKGYWDNGEQLLKDKHERYEISFKGDDNFKKLVNYLSKVCKEAGEDAIYLTVADESYLVRSQ